MAELRAGTILDGEVVVLAMANPTSGGFWRGRTVDRPCVFALEPRRHRVTYIVFDLLYLRFESLLEMPLRQRRQKLGNLIAACGEAGLVLSEGMVGRGKAFFAEV